MGDKEFTGRPPERYAVPEIKEPVSLGNCRCINPVAAAILGQTIEQEIARVERFIEAPYGAPVEVIDYLKERLAKLYWAEDAVKGLELCEPLKA